MLVDTNLGSGAPLEIHHKISLDQDIATILGKVVVDKWQDRRCKVHECGMGHRLPLPREVEVQFFLQTFLVEKEEHQDVVSL